MVTKITTTTTAPVTVSSIARIVRTLVQSVIAFGAAEPVLIGLLHLNAMQSSKVAGVVSALVFVASALQNVLEHFGITPTVAGKLVPPVAAPTPAPTGLTLRPAVTLSEN